jgi:hypothetical protein
MTTHIATCNPIGGDVEEQSRKRLKQMLASMSLRSLEARFSHPNYRCGLIKTHLREPENKLRDLARYKLGMSEESLGELDIKQVGRLFYDRGMTFTAEQLCNTGFRRMKEYAVNGLLRLCRDPKCDPLSTVFFLHDERGDVFKATMTQKEDYFLVNVESIDEGPLYEGDKGDVVLRNKHPETLWPISIPEESERFRSPLLRSMEKKGDVCRLEDIEWMSKIYMPPLTIQKATHKAAKCLKKMLERQEFSSTGMGLYQSQRHEADERTLVGFREYPPTPGHGAYVEAFGRLAQVLDESVPMPMDPEDRREKFREEWLRATMHERGMTFSLSECAWIAHRLIRGEFQRHQDEMNMLVYDEEGNLFDVFLRLKRGNIEQRIYLHPKGNRRGIVCWWSDLAIKLPGTAGCWSIAGRRLLDPRGSFELPPRS